jgi:undecaprenyl-diphosphatase
MTFFESILLGAVQGATEFLPISSSGHLVLGQELLGVEEPGLLFDIVLHVGTLLAVVVYYRQDVLSIIQGCLRLVRRLSQTGISGGFRGEEGARVALLVGVATVPTGLIGLGLKGVLEPDHGSPLITPEVVCGILLCNGCILMTNRWLQRRAAVERLGTFTAWSVDPMRAFLIGIAQGVAVLPGISRSGTTITLSLALGIGRADAARFSFLLSIPAILGAVVLQFDASLFSGSTGGATFLVFAAGAAVAGLVGFFCIGWLVKILERARFHHFAWYCWVVGAAGLLAFHSMA